MKLWKNEPYMPDNKGLVQVVVMAETRQQAIEKASAELLRVLGHVFPDDDYRRFAQLGSDNLDSTIEEAPHEVVIIIVGPPSVEDQKQPDTSKPTGRGPSPQFPRVIVNHHLARIRPASPGTRQACPSQTGKDDQ
jgi:hypothetical protein